MPKKNVKGGNKYRKAKKIVNNDEKKEILLKEDGQEYAFVSKALGNRRFKLLCADSVERIGIIRGKIKKSQWITSGTFVLICIRDFEDGTCDIFHVYEDDAKNSIKKHFETSLFKAQIDCDIVQFENETTNNIIFDINEI
jgi:translation initiation factor 1A